MSCPKEPHQKPPQEGGALLDPVEVWTLSELAQGRSVTLKALGGSMRPWIRSGERLTLTPCAPSELRVGGVYAFADLTRPEGQRLSPLHRAWWVSGEWVYGKGDSLPRFDPPTRQRDVVARVCLAPRSTDTSEGGETGEVGETSGGGSAAERLSFYVRAQGVSGALWPLALLTSLSYSALSRLSRASRLT